MKRSKLDKIDRKILLTLQEDGRITNVDLAKRAGISAPPCLRRVRALEESGFIRSYHAFLDPNKLGYGITVFAHVSLDSHNDADLRKFETKIREWPQVREAHLLSGDTDVLLKVVAPDWEAYQQFLTNELLATSNVSAVRSSIAIRTSKMEPGVPINDNLQAA
ncbi:MAG TPA: Lrp/AsnC family transcriptional regulator [Alphaproteobacteria bacterium]